MPDLSLHGNHDPCPACELRRDGKRGSYRDAPDCNLCGGSGFLALTAVEIIRRTCDEARRLYWPAAQARWAAFNAAKDTERHPQ